MRVRLFFNILGRFQSLGLRVEVGFRGVQGSDRVLGVSGIRVQRLSSSSDPCGVILGVEGLRPLSFWDLPTELDGIVG